MDKIEIFKQCKADAVKHNNYEELKKGNNVIYKVTNPISGLLPILRRVYPDNYVGKEYKENGLVIYTVYSGEKEYMKRLLNPCNTTRYPLHMVFSENKEYMKRLFKGWDV